MHKVREPGFSAWTANQADCAQRETDAAGYAEAGSGYLFVEI
jgi:hypothetical protein